MLLRRRALGSRSALCVARRRLESLESLESLVCLESLVARRRTVTVTPARQRNQRSDVPPPRTTAVRWVPSSMRCACPSRRLESLACASLPCLVLPCLVLTCGRGLARRRTVTPARQRSQRKDAPSSTSTTTTTVRWVPPIMRCACPARRLESLVLALGLALGAWS